MNWLARAKTYFSQKSQKPTAKTDESPLLSVSSVPPEHIFKFSEGLLSVSSVGVVGIFENCIPASDLLQAAMRACDRWGDGPAARDQMRQDVLSTPHHLRQDLLQHFNKEYRT